MKPDAARRRWLAPEVVQSSAMDCGPAALKCLLEGHGVPASYGRLREACQTDVDGTSIDTLEDVANALGLAAEQVMVPADHVLLPAADLLPALVVVKLPNGITHFVVLWRRHGPLVQVMDPGTGRRWPGCPRVMRDLYVHRMPVETSAWRAWAGSEGFLTPLAARLAALGHSRPACDALIREACEDPGWTSLARLDAATRMTASLARAGAADRRAAPRLLEQCLAAARPTSAGTSVIPERCWSVRPLANDPDTLTMTGAVLLLVRGVRNAEAGAIAPGSDGNGASAALPPDLGAVLREAPVRPGRTLFELVREDGARDPAVLVGALAVAALGVTLEVLLFRGLLDVGPRLATRTARLGAVAALLVFLLALLALELPLMEALFRAGRRLEVRLRLAFLTKIPRLGDRYFRSRLTADMAERSHLVHGVRVLPEFAGLFLRRLFEVVLTTAGLVWLAPREAPLALLAALVAVAGALLSQGPVVERDLRVRSHAGALARFHLDALLGVVPIRAHGARRAVRVEHEGLLVEWARACRALLSTVVTVEALQAMTGFALAAVLVVRFASHGSAGTLLLLVYWALNLPVLGNELALLARQYPARRNQTLRVLEPLGAPGDTEGDVSPPAPARALAARGVAITFENVTVLAGGHPVLEDVTLDLPPGSHTAIVGPSGAGKSSLVGVLLGWSRASRGVVRVDGCPLAGRAIEQLRAETAWVDPAVHLWNRSLSDNLRYGAEPGGPSLAEALAAAELRPVLEALPDGLQTVLGEGGALVSGGEGQRVRFGRAVARGDARLVILDEAFRGLGPVQRRVLLERARSRWRGATLLCVTHDVSATLEFDRVLVVGGGRVVEDGAPRALVQRHDARYRALLDAERAVHDGLWSSSAWRRLELSGGQLLPQRTAVTVAR